MEEERRGVDIRIKERRKEEGDRKNILEQILSDKLDKSGMQCQRQLLRRTKARCNRRQRVRVEWWGLLYTITKICRVHVQKV